MKKKGVLIGALSMFLAFSLASCQEGGNLVPPALGDIKIEGIEDALIDSNKLKMSFNVGNEVTSFDLNKVKADGATITFKDSKGNDVSGSYSLEVGINRLTAIFKIGDEKIVYDLVITRNPLEKELLSIAVESLNNQYEVNSEFVAGKLKLSYSNNTSELIDLTLDMVEGFDTKTVGKKSLAIKYEGKECTYEIDVQEKVYKIASLNNRYLVGDEFSDGELLVKLFDNEEKVAITKDMVEGFDTTTPGKRTMTIKYDNKSFTYDYEVFLELLTVKSLKNEYIVGDTFTNGELSIKVGDKEDIVAITKDMVSGFDTTTPGEKTMTISYNNKSVEYTYVVYEELLAVKSLKNEYAINDEFTNGELIVKVGDKEEVIPLTLDMVSGFDTKTLGKKTLRIKYHKSELEYSYEVFDRELEIVEFKTKYILNSSFVNGKLKVKLGSSEEIVDITLDMVSGFDTTKVGSFDVVISYMGKEIKTAILVDKEENIYNSEIKNLLARVSVVQAILQGEPVDDINTFYNKKLEEILPLFDDASVKESADVLKSYNVTIDQLVAVSSLIDDEIVNAYTLYSKLDFENPDPVMEVISKLNKDDIDLIKRICGSASEIITVDQLAMLLPTDIYNDQFYEGNINVYINGNMESYSPTDFAKLIGMDKITTLVNAYHKLVTRGDNVGKVFAEAIIEVLGTVSKLDTDLAYDLLLEFRGEAINMLNICHKGALVVEDIYNNIDLSKVLTALKTLILANSHSNDLGGYGTFVLGTRVIDGAVEYLPDLIELAKSIDEESLNSIISIASKNFEEPINEADVRALVNICKLANPVLNKLKLDDELLLNFALSMYPDILGIDAAGIVDELIKLGELELKSEALTEEEIQEILTPLMMMLDSRSELDVYVSNDDRLFEGGLTIEEFINQMNDRYTIREYVNDHYEEYQITLDSLVDLEQAKLDIKTPGLHILKLKINEELIYPTYYIYDNLDITLNPSYFEQTLGYTAIFDSKTNEAIGLKVFNHTVKLEDMLQFTSFNYKYYLEDIDYAGELSLTNNAKYSVIKGENGFGALMIEDTYHTIYLPIRICEIDFENVKAVAHVSDSKGSNNVVITRLDAGMVYLDLDDKLQILFNLSELLVPLENKLGVQSASVNILGKTITFDLNVISEEEGKMVGSIDYVSAIDPNNIMESFLSNVTKIKYYTKDNMCHDRYVLNKSGASFIDYLNMVYATSDIKIELINNDGAIASYRLTLAKGSDELLNLTFEAKVKTLEEVQKQIYFELDSNTLYIDSNLYKDYYNGNYDKDELNKQLMNSLLKLLDQREAVIRTYEGFNRTYNLKNYILENNIPISFEVLKNNQCFAYIGNDDGLYFSIRDEGFIEDHVEGIYLTPLKAEMPGYYSRLDEIEYKLFMLEFSRSHVLFLRRNNTYVELSGDELYDYLNKVGGKLNYKISSGRIVVDVYINGYGFTNIDANMDFVDMHKLSYLPDQCVLQVKNPELVSKDELLRYYDKLGLVYTDSPANIVKGLKLIPEDIVINSFSDKGATIEFNLSIKVNGSYYELVLPILKLDDTTQDKDIKLELGLLNVTDLNALTYNDIKDKLLASINGTSIIGYELNLVNPVINAFVQGKNQLKIYITDDNHAFLRAEGIYKMANEELYSDYFIRSNQKQYNQTTVLYLEDNTVEGFTNWLSNVDSLSIIPDLQLDNEKGSVKNLFSAYSVNITKENNGFKVAINTHSGDFVAAFFVKTTTNINDILMINYHLISYSMVANSMDDVIKNIDYIEIIRELYRTEISGNEVEDFIRSHNPRMTEDNDSYYITIDVEGFTRRLGINKKFKIQNVVIDFGNAKVPEGGIDKEFIMGSIVSLAIETNSYNGEYNKSILTAEEINKLFTHLRVENYSDTNFGLVWENGSSFYSGYIPMK